MKALQKGAVVLAAALAVVATAACGVPADGHPRALSANGVPFDLMTATPSTVPEQAGATGDVTHDIYILGQAGRLVPVTRTFTESADLTSVLEKLLAGPSPGELAAGFQSFISTQTRLLGADVDANGVATIDVSREFTEVSGNLQVLALAQIVYTATGIPGVQAVRFSLGGDPKEVPTQDGILTERPLTRSDYARLAER